jgi:hypothetical protein
MGDHWGLFGFNVGVAFLPNVLDCGKELLLANTIQIDTMYQLLIQKGYFTEAEFLAKMKAVQRDYQAGKH